jgi:hypothetical protein
LSFLASSPLASSFLAFSLKLSALLLSCFHPGAWRGLEAFCNVRNNVPIDAIDVTFFKKIDAKIQFLQRIIANHDGRMLARDISSTGALWLGTTFQANKIEPEILFLSSFDKKDWMFRPKVRFNIGTAWQWTIGGDFFGGERSGYFGQFKDRDRVYSEIKFVF